MINLTIVPNQVDGLGQMERIQLQQLIEVFNYHNSKNATKARYYEGHIPLSEVNLGLAIPKGFKNLEISCEWGAKCVDVLASRSMFDGFVSMDGNDADEIMSIMNANNLVSEYMKACRDELQFGCTFATLSADDDIQCRIRFHSPMSASALWNGERGRIECGMAIIDTVKDEKDKTWSPSHINLYTDESIWELIKIDSRWEAIEHPHRMGRPLMEPMIWNATSRKPFGRSRIKESVRRLIQGYVRTVANATIGLEFSTSPQKYMLGLTDDQYDAVISDKFRQYIGSVLASTYNPETGEKPTVGQFSQGSIEPHVQMLRILATQFSAATGLTVTDTGVVNDANPTSSDAILAQSQTLVSLAEQLNAGNAKSLKTIAEMAQAVVKNCSLNELEDNDRNIIPHFKNPAMPSVAVTADAAIKIASTRQGFGATDVFLEMVGFDQADIRRIKAQEKRNQGNLVIQQEFNSNVVKSMNSNVKDKEDADNIDGVA